MFGTTISSGSTTSYGGIYTGTGSTETAGSIASSGSGSSGSIFSA